MSKLKTKSTYKGINYSALSRLKRGERSVKLRTVTAIKSNYNERIYRPSSKALQSPQCYFICPDSFKLYAE